MAYTFGFRDFNIGDNFGGRTPAWHCKRVRRDGDNFRVFARKRAVIEANLPKPEHIPDAPANAARPAARVSP